MKQQPSALGHVHFMVSVIHLLYSMLNTRCFSAHCTNYISHFFRTSSSNFGIDLRRKDIFIELDGIKFGPISIPNYQTFEYTMLQ